MSEVGERYRKVAARFTETARGVPEGGWARPAPCEGWVARDVVAHLVGWVPGVLEAGGGVELPVGPSVEDDPVGAWLAMSDGIQAVLDEPGVEERRFSHPQAGDHSLDGAIAMLVVGDVLLHTWDLARATGQDETLDPDEVTAMLAGMQPFDDILRQSGHYGPKVAVADDADDQTRLIAFVGRQP